MADTPTTPSLPASLGVVSARTQELAHAIAATAGWATVKAKIAVAVKDGHDQAQIVALGRAALSEAELDGNTMLASTPGQCRDALKGEAGAQAAEALDLYMIASVLSDIESGQPLPVLPLAGGGVRTEVIEQGDVEFPWVQAFVTPLGDPVAVAAQFLETCYRVMPPEVFAQRPESSRDADWWRRHEQGESFREIALSDERSGLTPEVMVSPSEYPAEVNRATDRVRRAVRRFRARWTQAVDGMSKDKG